MKVRDVMTSSPRVISQDATLQEAAETMRTLDVGPLPVCDEDGRLIGMVTDRDITVRATAEGQDPYTTSVRGVMTRDVAYVFDDQKVQEAVRIMQERQVRRLPVLDRGGGWLVGILSLSDIALSGADEDLTVNTLETVSAPGQPARW